MQTHIHLSRNRLLALVCAGGLLAIPCTTFALSLTRDVDRAYLREHANEFSVKVAKNTAGLIAFTIERSVPKPKYFVARTTIRRGDQPIFESHLPLFTRKNTHTFHLAIAAEHLSGAEFELSESFFAENNGDPVPLPGTMTYRFRLNELIPDELRDSLSR